MPTVQVVQVVPVTEEVPAGECRSFSSCTSFQTALTQEKSEGAGGWRYRGRRLQSGLARRWPTLLDLLMQRDGAACLAGTLDPAATSAATSLFLPLSMHVPCFLPLAMCVAPALRVPSSLMPRRYGGRCVWMRAPDASLERHASSAF